MGVGSVSRGPTSPPPPKRPAGSALAFDRHLALRARHCGSKVRQGAIITPPQPTEGGWRPQLRAKTSWCSQNDSPPGRRLMVLKISRFQYFFAFLSPAGDSRVTSFVKRTVFVTAWPCSPPLGFPSTFSNQCRICWQEQNVKNGNVHSE